MNEEHGKDLTQSLAQSGAVTRIIRNMCEEEVWLEVGKCRVSELRMKLSKMDRPRDGSSWVLRRNDADENEGARTFVAFEMTG